jgi:hypothetical protein
MDRIHRMKKGGRGKAKVKRSKVADEDESRGGKDRNENRDRGNRIHRKEAAADRRAERLSTDCWGRWGRAMPAVKSGC